MTNVPNEIREMWADLYRLFDVSYNMENSKESWQKFWDTATKIRNKYSEPHVMAMIYVVSDMVDYHLTGQLHHPCTLEDMKLF